MSGNYMPVALPGRLSLCGNPKFPTGGTLPGIGLGDIGLVGHSCGITQD